MKKLFAALALTLAASFAAAGSAPQSAGGALDDLNATPAYGVLALRKVAVEADLVDLSSKLTDDSPNVRAKRFELSVLSREMERLQEAGRVKAPRLSSAYGNLILSKVALEVELNGLLSSFTSEHPDVKKKRVELTGLEREIENLLR